MNRSIEELRKGFGTAAGRAGQVAAYHDALLRCCDEIETLRARLSRQQEWIDAVMGQEKVGGRHSYYGYSDFIIRPQPLAKE